MDPAAATEAVDDEDVCRICRNPGDADNPLRYPCACRGSIKFVHQNCLLQWLKYSNTRLCEVCKHPFSFSLMYAENAPTRLPFQDFLLGIAMKYFPVLHFFLRTSFVLSLWLLTIPLITFWMWRLTFVRSFGEAQRLFLSHISVSVILTDCLLGFFLLASIVFFGFGVILKDYFRRVLELGEQEETEDEGDSNNRNLAGQGNGEGAAVGQIVNRNPEDVLPRLEIQVFEVDHIFDDPVANAFNVLASNMIFFGVVIFVPFTLGRVILYHVSWLFTTVRDHAVTASMHFTDAGLSLENITLKIALTTVSNLTNEGQENGLLGQLTEMMKVNGSELNGANNTLSVAADLLKCSAAGASKLSDVITLTVGYMFIVFLVFLYIGIIALIQYANSEPLTVSIVEAVPSLRQFLAAMRHLMTMIKVAFFFVIILGVESLMFGWWLDVCTVRLFGKTMSHRVQFLSISPLASSLGHWVVGNMYMLQMIIFENLLRGALRPGVLYFLRDPDPNHNPFRDSIDDPVHKQAQEFLIEVAVYGSLIVMLVFLPVKLAIWMAPSIFPLEFSVFTEIPADILLFQICIQFTIERFHQLESLVHCWLTGVGWALGLTDFLLPRPEDNIGQDDGNGEQDRQDRAMAALPAADDPNNSLFNAGNGNTGEEYGDDEEQSDLEYNFVVRIILLLLVAWVTLLLFNSALIVVPISLGRTLFSAIPLLPITHGIKSNDLYAFVIGTYVIWTTISGAWYAIEHVKSKRTFVSLNQIWKWCGIVFKSSVLLAIWYFIIPVLIGLLFELLVIVPMRVPLDESPVFLLYQEWTLGLIFWKIWTRLVMLDLMLPIVGDSWRTKFERVREDGFSRLQGLWVLKEIVFPIVMKLLTALCMPYVLARGVFTVLGYPLVVNSAVYRFAWIGCLSVSLFCLCAKRCHVWFRNVHNSIRDDRYLIGWKLHNFGEAA